MMNQKQIKYVVDETNQLLKRNYHMISFNSLSPEELLRLLGEILKSVSEYLIVQTDESVTNEMITTDLFSALQKIKYEPSGDIAEFRDGLLQGNPRIIHPIMFWVLDNRNDIAKRAYLSYFVEPPAMPREMESDPDVNTALVVMRETAAQFWQCYRDYLKEKSVCDQSTEIVTDIQKMQTEVAQLEQRIIIQSEKAPTVRNSAALEAVKSYRRFDVQTKQLSGQLEGINKLTAELHANISHLKKLVDLNVNLHELQNTDPVNRVVEQKRVNEILFNEQVEILQRLRFEEDVMTSDDMAVMPTKGDIDDRSREENQIVAEMKGLRTQMAQLTNEADRELYAFRAQVDMISEKRTNLSNTLMELRQASQKVEMEKASKAEMYQKLTGGVIDRGGDNLTDIGGILQGDMLKQAVQHLRERSIVYKKLREELAGLYSEVNIASRTLDVLQSLEPQLSQHLDSANNNRGTLDDHSDFISSDDDPKELKRSCVALYNRWKQQRLQLDDVQSEIANLRTSFNQIEDSINLLKSIFNDKVLSLPDDVAQMRLNIDSLETSIKTHENDWRSLQLQTELIRSKRHTYEVQLIEKDGLSAEMEASVTMAKKKDELSSEVKWLSDMLSDSDKLKLEGEMHVQSIQKVRQLILAIIEADESVPNVVM